MSRQRPRLMPAVAAYCRFGFGLADALTAATRSPHPALARHTLPHGERAVILDWTTLSPLPLRG